MTGHVLLPVTADGGKALAVYLDPHSRHGLHRLAQMRLPLCSDSWYPILRVPSCSVEVLMGEAKAMAVLLYDGTCGFCNRAVRLILRHDRRKTLRFASLGGAYGRAVAARHAELRETDSMAWVDVRHSAANARILLRSDAALRVAEYLAGPWKLLLVLRVLPRPIRDRGYDLVARHRHRLVGGSDRCPIPPPEWRARFIDDVR